MLFIYTTKIKKWLEPVFITSQVNSVRRYRAAASPACSQLKSLLVCFAIFSEGIVFFLHGSCYKNDLKEFRFT